MLKRYDPGLPLYFCFVPRTGGTSLTNVFYSAIGRDRVRVNPGPAETVGNHFNRELGYGIETVYPSAYQFYTILRDPFERMVSWYFYVKSRPNGSMRLAPNAPPTKLSDYGETLAEVLVRAPADATRYLPPGRYPQMLDDFLFVGSTERLLSAARFLTGLFGVPCPRKMPRANAAVRDEEVTEDMRERFREEHAEDYDLYAYAVEKWRPVWDAVDEECK